MCKYKTIDLCAGIRGRRKGFELTGKAGNFYLYNLIVKNNFYRNSLE